MEAAESTPIAGEKTPETPPTPAAEYLSLLRRFALRLWVAVTLAAVLLTCGELLSYWHYAAIPHDTLDPLVRMELGGGDASERKYLKELGDASTVTYYPYVLWRRAPYHGEMISIDQDGLRQTLHSQCDGKTFTIWMFGDSVMWGSGAADGETIPSWLAADYEKAGRKVCIVNYGEMGWANTQEVIELIELLKHASRKPDVVVFYDGGSEAFTALQARQADVHSNFNGFKKYLDEWSVEQRAGFSYLHRTNTYRMLQGIAAAVTPRGKKERARLSEAEAQELSDGVIQNYVQNMGIVDLLAKQYGFRPVFAWYPNIAVGHKQLTAHEKELQRLEYLKFPGLDMIYQAAYDRSRQLRLPDFYYLADILDDQKSSLYLGVAHLKPEGYRITADELFRILEQSPRATPVASSADRSVDRGSRPLRPKGS